MKKITLSTFLILLCAQFTHAEKTPAQDHQQAALAQNQTTTIRIDNRPAIMGLWGMEIPTNKKCTEYYNFRGNNEVIVNSAKEWSTGLYDYQPSTETKEKSPALLMQIKYENNEMDCSGRQEDQSGEVSQYFVRWKDQNTINFCATDGVDKCFAVLHRVQP